MANDVTNRHLPFGLTWIRIIQIVIAIALLVVMVQLPQWIQNPTQVDLLTRALYFGIAAMGLNLLTGFNGQVSIGHGAFFAIGAYTSAILVTDHGWNYYATLPAAAALCFAVGAAVGFPALRVKGFYLALLTLGLAVLLPDLASRFVNGAGGQPQVLVSTAALTRPSLADFLSDYATAPDQWHYYVTLVISGLMLLAAWGLVRAGFGRSLIAVRDHEAAASTVGINPARVKVSAFAISALYAGVAGALSVQVLGFANADKVEIFRLSIEFLVMVVIGGTATVLGPILGGFAFVYIDDKTVDLISGKAVLSPAIFGAILIIFMYVMPDGLVGGARRLAATTARVLAQRRPSEPLPTTTT